MKQRIFSFIILLLIVALSLNFFGVHAGVVIIVILTYFTQLELYILFEKMGLKPMKPLGLLCGLLISTGSYYTKCLETGNDLFLLSFLILTLTIIGKDLHAGRLRSFMPTLFGLIFVPYMLHFFIEIVLLAETNGETSTVGLFLAIWVVAVAKSTDIGGLLVGSKLGRNSLCLISPKKTYEGAIGGIIFSIFIGWFVFVLFNRFTPEEFRWWMSLLIPIPIAFASIGSDLVESALKRQANVKDSGNIIPGIGGIFDLTDSLILTAPLGYLIFKYMLY